MPISKTAFGSIPLSDSARQTNCFITWNTFVWGTEPTIRKGVYKGAACINPLTWKADTVYASASMNEGGLPYSYKHIDRAVCDAQIHEGLLWIHPPAASGYYRVKNFYHLADVNLFYMNLRKNACDRTAVYLRKRKNS